MELSVGIFIQYDIHSEGFGKLCEQVLFQMARGSEKYLVCYCMNVVTS